MINFNELTQAMSDLDDEKVESILDDVISEGGDSVAKALEACQDGMNEVGSRFETGEYYVSDLIFAIITAVICCQNYPHILIIS